MPFIYPGNHSNPPSHFFTLMHPMFPLSTSCTFIFSVILYFPPSFFFVPIIYASNPFSPVTFLFLPSCILFLPLALLAPLIFPRHPFLSPPHCLFSPSLIYVAPSHFLHPFISSLNLSCSSLAFVPFTSPVILDFPPPHVICLLMHFIFSLMHSIFLSALSASFISPL